ncbi:MAG: hypothetical protein R3Y32_03165 [Bacillota bacterium]
MNFGYSNFLSQEIKGYIDNLILGTKKVECNSINDFIELYQFEQKIEIGVCHGIWTSVDVDRLLKEIKKEINIYSNTLTNDNILTKTKDISKKYKKYFFEIFNKYKLYNKIDEIIFAELYKFISVSLSEVFSYSKTIQKYSDFFKNELLNKNDILVFAKFFSDKTMIMPRGITNSELNDKIEELLDDKNIEFGNLSNLYYAEKNGDFFIRDDIKLKAKNLEEIKSKETRNSGFGVKYEIGYIESQDEVIDVNFDNLSYKKTYDLRWIKDNLDFPTLMNNFIYLLGLVDGCNNIAFLSQALNISIIDMINGGMSKDSRLYKKDFSQQLTESIYYVDFVAYRDILQKNGVSLESLIEWFFNVYIKEEFGIENYDCVMPSEGNNIYQKCRLCAIEIESIIKKWSMLTQRGEIDYELLSFASPSTLFEDIGSFIDNKYVSIIDGKFDDIARILFSNQSELLYKGEFGVLKEENSLCDLLCKKAISCDIYNEPWEKEAISKLLASELVILNDQDILEIVDINIVRDLLYLRKNKFCNKSYLHKETIHYLEKHEFIEYLSKLLSKRESEYFNYQLNKKQFINGHDLRNKYVHGAVNASEDTKYHEENYNQFLMQIILLILKMNCELCETNT